MSKSIEDLDNTCKMQQKQIKSLINQLDKTQSVLFSTIESTISSLLAFQQNDFSFIPSEISNMQSLKQELSESITPNTTCQKSIGIFNSSKQEVLNLIEEISDSSDF